MTVSPSFPDHRTVWSGARIPLPTSGLHHVRDAAVYQIRARRRHGLYGAGRRLLWCRAIVWAAFHNQVPSYIAHRRVFGGPSARHDFPTYHHSRAAYDCPVDDH